MWLQRNGIQATRLTLFGIRQQNLYMPNGFTVYYRGRHLKETSQNQLLLTLKIQENEKKSKSN